tara:strand:+ start:89 stop:328 length:240 start_codon:yes stop_codon:yes gene_type:complete
MAVFAREIVGREVINPQSELLGILRDIVFDKQSGSISALRVELEPNLDSSAFPWELQDGLMQIPVDEVARVASKVHLKR